MVATLSRSRDLDPPRNGVCVSDLNAVPPSPPASHAKSEGVHDPLPHEMTSDDPPLTPAVGAMRILILTLTLGDKRESEESRAPGPSMISDDVMYPAFGALVSSRAATSAVGESTV